MKRHLLLSVAVLMVTAGAYARGPAPGGGGPPPPSGEQFQPGQQPPGQPGQQPPGQPGQQPPGQGGQQPPGQPGPQPPGQGGPQPPGQQGQQGAGQTMASSLTPDDLLNNASLSLTADQKAKIKRVSDSIVRQIKKVLTPAQLKTWRDGKFGKLTVARVLAKSAALGLTAEQTAQLGKITDQSAAQAKAVLTAGQANQVAGAGQGGMGPGGPGGRFGPPPRGGPGGRFGPPPGGPGGGPPPGGPGGGPPPGGPPQGN